MSTTERVLFVVLGLISASCAESTGDGDMSASRAPDFSPCPSGWIAIRAGSATVCAPWSPEDGIECPAGQARFVGTGACERVGTACPSGAFPTDLPSDVPILYVSADAPRGGDGSRGAPFATITSALDAAQIAGTVIAVGKGAYQGPLEIPGTVVVWGACPEETTVHAEYPLVVLASGPNAGLRNLRVTGTAAGIWVQGTSIDVRDVIVEDSTTVGVLIARGGAARLTRVVVRGTTPDPSMPKTGIGIAIEDGSSVVLDRVVVSGNHSDGIAASGAETVLEAADLAILGTRAGLDGSLGFALEVRSGARATLSRVLVDRNQRGVFVDGAGSSLTMNDVAIVGPRADDEAVAGDRGLAAQNGAVVTAQRLWIDSVRDGGLVAISASIDVTDLVVRRTQPRMSDGTFGRGIGVRGPDASVRIVSSLVEDNHEVGVSVDGEGALLRATDLVVRGTQSLPRDGTGGRGIGVQNGARAEITDAWIVDNREAGVLAHYDASIVLTDVTIEGTRSAACGSSSCPDFALGDGALVAFGARATLERFVITDNARAGIAVGPGAEVDLTRGEVARNPIGASVQAEAFDVRRLQNEVVFVDNGRNLDRGSLALPEPSASF